MRVVWTLLAVLIVAAIAATVFIFQRSNAGDLALQIPAPHGQRGVNSLDARLFQPDGEGPFPAVVLAHGCSGWHGSNVTDWASWFVDHGFAALMVDSFGPRRVEGVCSDPTQARPTPRERAMDAYDALDYLSGLPSIDSSRTMLMGFSHGGTTAVVAAGKGVGFRPSDRTPRFQAVVAMYPWCGLGPGSFSKPSLPALIVVGQRDDWTPASLCLQRAKRFDDLDVHVIKGATHSFDMFRWKGEPLSSRNFRGYRLTPSRSATKEARRVVEAFMRANALLEN